MSKQTKKTNYNFDFQGKTALITGAAKGMGRATAEMLTGFGCRVVLLDRDGPGLTSLKKKFPSSLADRVDLYEVDVTSRKALEELKGKIGKIDYLINVVGLSARQEQGLLEEEVFDRLIAVNLKSAYLTSMIFGYNSIKKNGAIVNVSSIRARTGTPSFSAGYGAAKAGVINLTKSMAMELAERKIRVNGVAPGPTYPTGLSRNWPQKMREELAETIPLKRLAKPEDIAKVICFLLSDLAGYLTGQTIDVNGGLWMN